jgi:hypothetical protein
LTSRQCDLTDAVIIARGQMMLPRRTSVMKTEVRYLDQCRRRLVRKKL